MTNPNGTSTRGQSVAVKAVLVIAAITAVLYLTNPTHLRHVARLFPGRPAPLDLIDTSQLSPVDRALVEKNHPATSSTVYHDYRLFSTTTVADGDGLLSVGFARIVVDLRSN